MGFNALNKIILNPSQAQQKSETFIMNNENASKLKQSHLITLETGALYNMKLNI